MNIIRSLGLILLCALLGLALGAVGTFFIAKQYVATADLAIDAEALASGGLARFDRVNIADSVEVPTLVQLLKSPRVSHAVATRLGLASHRVVEDNLKIVNDAGSPVVKIKLAADSPAQAQAITRGIVEEAVAIDAAKKQQRTAEAVEAVRTQLAESEKQLGGLNREIQKLTADRGISLSNESERQQRAAMELAQLEQRLSGINVESAGLQDRMRRIQELIAAIPAGRTLPAGFEIQEADKSPGLAEARTRLLEQESALASVRTRYGAQHPKVQAAEAEVAATRKALHALLLTQREIVKAQVADTESARKIVEKKIAATEAEARQHDLSLDPAHANLLAQRDAITTDYGLLTTRLSELRVFAAAHPATFYVFSPPTLPDRASLLRPAALLALCAVCGALLGAGLCVRRWASSEHTIARAVHAAP